MASRSCGRLLQLGGRAAEGNAADRRLARRQCNDVRQAGSAAEKARRAVIAGRGQSPDLLEELRRPGGVSELQLHALQPHSPRKRSAFWCMIFSITVSL